MNYKRYNFKDLIIDTTSLYKLLGYGNGNLPEPINFYLEEAFAFADELTDIQSVYRIINSQKSSPNKNMINVGDISFHVGKIIYEELVDAKRYALFICTAGTTICKKISQLFHTKEYIKGYVFDLVGSQIVESVGDQMQEQLKKNACDKDEHITNRFSPGYCQWKVKEQFKLFSFFPNNCCGVSLTSSALMTPIKSISGIIGIGKNVKFQDYRCEFCNNVECFYRKNHLHTH